MEPSTKKPRGLWSLQQLRDAMAAVQGGLMSQRAAAARYSIPRRTLVNHLKSGKVEKQIGRRTVLTKEQEDDLAARIKRLAYIGFPLTPNVIRRQAYVFCEKHNISNNFSPIAKRAGKDWLKLFLKRHPDISKRKVQILNPGRAQKLNKPIVLQHFAEYKKIYEELELGQNPQRLYNMDEKGCRLTIHNQPIVLAQKGAKRVHMVAPEHAENVTVACCVNALGSPIPPMILFKGKRLKPEFNDNLPAGSLVKMAKKGSMTSTLFVDFIHHLGKYKAAGRCLLVFDGASCHLDYDIVDAAEQHNIVLYCLPSNTTHELQPLDKSVNKSFEHHWDEETLRYLYQNPEKKLTKARFNSIFSKVWSKCMTVENIINGFRATGLYPYNPDAIPDEAYAPSIMTERCTAPENLTTENDQMLLVGSRSLRQSILQRSARDSADSEKTFYEEQDNGQSLQKSPTPGPSGINLQHAVQRSDVNNLDFDDAFFRNHYSDSPSLLDPNDSLLSVITSAEVKRQLVDYSSSDSELPNPNPNVPIDQSKYDATIRRPIIYSSESDTDITEVLIPQLKPQYIRDVYSSSDDDNMDPISRHVPNPKKQTTCINMNSTIYNSESDSSITQRLVPRQKLTPQYIRDVYSSSDDENINPKLRHEHTPKKRRTRNDMYLYNTRQVREGSATTSESEDNLPLSSLKKKVVKSPFGQLIPTPNFSEVKQKKPRRKAINYKARIVTKDLFVEKENKKDKKQQNKRRIEDYKPPHTKRNKKEQQSKNKTEKSVEKCTIKKKYDNKQNKEQELRNRRQKQMNQTRSKKTKINSDNQIDSADKWYCHACKTESFEDMRQCTKCYRWYHDNCMGLTKDDIDFECHMCNSTCDIYYT